MASTSTHPSFAWDDPLALLGRAITGIAAFN